MIGLELVISIVCNSPINLSSVPPPRANIMDVCWRGKDLSAGEQRSTADLCASANCRIQSGRKCGSDWCAFARVEVGVFGAISPFSFLSTALDMRLHTGRERNARQSTSDHARARHRSCWSSRVPLTPQDIIKRVPSALVSVVVVESERAGGGVAGGRS